MPNKKRKNLDDLINEAIEDLYLKYKKIEKIIDLINDKKTSPAQRLKLYNLLPDDIKKNINIDKNGNLSDQQKINNDFLKKIMGVIDDINKNWMLPRRDRKSDDEILFKYQNLPPEKNNPISYKQLVQYNKRNTPIYKNYKDFVKLFRNLTDPVKIDSTELYDVKSRKISSKKDKDIALNLNLRNSNTYASNKFIQNMYSKIATAMAKIFNNEKDNDNKYIKKLIKIIEKTSGDKKVKRNTIEVPYTYLLNLAYSNNKDMQLAFIEICLLLLKYNIFFEPSSKDERDAYVYFEENLKKWKKYIQNGGSLLDVNKLSIEERNKKIDNISFDDEDNNVEKNVKTIDDIFKIYYNNNTEEFKNNLINIIKKHLFITDEEWNSFDDDEKTNYIIKFKDYYDKNFNNKNL